MKTARILLALFFILPCLARAETAPECLAFVDDGSPTPSPQVKLEPMPQDPHMMSAREGHYSFLVDWVDLAQLNSVRMFIYDLQSNVTSMSDASFTKIGHQELATVQQVIGYGTAHVTTLSVSCYLTQQN